MVLSITGKQYVESSLPNQKESEQKLAQVARALVGNISEQRIFGIGPKPMT
jgi:hypothetical protein